MWCLENSVAGEHPLFTLATGMGSLLDKQIRHLRPTRLTLWVRPEMAEYCRRRVVPRMTVPSSSDESASSRAACSPERPPCSFARRGRWQFLPVEYL